MFGGRGFDAVTIADVAVQTVFNHFATKEELFFDGRADWVDGAARAVRECPAGVPPLSALREHLTASVSAYLTWLSDPAHRAVIATLEASPTLCAYERELHHECVRRLSEALSEAAAAVPQRNAAETQLMAPLTAAVWMAAIRALVVEQRSHLAQGGDDAARTEAVAVLAERVLEKFEDMAPATPRVQVTGWPTAVRRAG